MCCLSLGVGGVKVHQLILRALPEPPPLLETHIEHCPYDGRISVARPKEGPRDSREARAGPPRLVEKECVCFPGWMGWMDKDEEEVVSLLRGSMQAERERHLTLTMVVALVESRRDDGG